VTPDDADSDLPDTEVDDYDDPLDGARGDDEPDEPPEDTVLGDVLEDE